MNTNLPEEVTAHVVKLYKALSIPLENVGVDRRVDVSYCMEILVAYIQALAVDGKKTKVPKDWWNALKLRWFKRWLPVDYREITTMYVCPHLDVGRQSHVTFLAYHE